MAVTIETMISLITVASLWGVTNPFMKKEAQGINKVKLSTARNQVFKDIFFLTTNFKCIGSFLINQSGSLLYIFILQKNDLSLTIVVVNSLTFVMTSLTGNFLGEDKVHKYTYIGVILILTGTLLCCIDKITIFN